MCDFECRESISHMSLFVVNAASFRVGIF
jgi:hypothetical protein